MNLTKKFDRWLNVYSKKRGIVLMRLSNPKYYLGRRMKLMKSYGIELVLDIGANSGQYATQLRSLGYAGEIVSFEPMADAFENLREATAEDPRWTCMKFGLSDEEGTSFIHVSANSISSSLLPMLGRHLEHAHGSGYIRNEEITLHRLDELPDASGWATRNTWIKIDVQGLEHKVLGGARNLLEHVAAIQIELSMVPLYAGQLTIIPTLELLRDLGFELVAVEPGFEDHVTGEYLQVDGIFRNVRMRNAGRDRQEVQRT